MNVLSMDNTEKFDNVNSTAFIRKMPPMLKVLSPCRSQMPECGKNKKK